jgi:hypothetical protein
MNVEVEGRLGGAIYAQLKRRHLRLINFDDGRSRAGMTRMWLLDCSIRIFGVYYSATALYSS